MKDDEGEMLADLPDRSMKMRGTMVPLAAALVASVTIVTLAGTETGSGASARGWLGGGPAATGRLVGPGSRMAGWPARPDRPVARAWPDRGGAVIAPGIRQRVAGRTAPPAGGQAAMASADGVRPTMGLFAAVVPGGAAKHRAHGAVPTAGLPMQGDGPAAGSWALVLAGAGWIGSFLKLGRRRAPYR